MDIKLSEIKQKMVAQLSGLTIDDFYFEPEVEFAKATFEELTGQETDEEIENYLKQRFPETTVEARKFDIEKEIAGLKEKISKKEAEAKNIESEIDKIEQQILSKANELKEIPVEESKIKSDLKEIEAEIIQINTLATKEPYSSRIKDLEKGQEKKNKELAELSPLLQKLNAEIDDLRGQVKAKQDSINEKISENTKIESEINSKQNELEEIRQKEDTYFKEEYSSLEFLYGLLLRKAIYKKEVLEYKKTGKKLYNVGYAVDEVVTETTGEVELKQHYLGLEEYCKFVAGFINSKNVKPKDWRKVLYATLSQEVPAISGKIKKVDNGSFFTEEILELTKIDLSALLATKIAAKHNYSLSTTENRIILALSGGLCAKISFREKGKVISMVQENPIEVWSNCLKLNQYVSQVLYHQTGYADSKIEITTPGSYYILSDKYVIEIEYLAAPILFENAGITRFSPNISGKAKHEDEIEAETERKRQEEYDDWFYDDDE